MEQNRAFLLLTGVVFVVTVIVALQGKSLRALKKEVVALSGKISVSQGDTAPTPQSPVREIIRTRPSTDHSARLEQIEHSIAQLTRATEYLMERGQLPLATNKIEDLQRRLADTALTERERLQALRLLRRGGTLSDENLLVALGLMQSSTNANVRRGIIDILDGVTNAAAREPLLALASNDPDSEVREDAVGNLRNFILDPKVEAKLWELLKSDPDPEIREQAEEALREGPMSPDRIARLQQWATDPQTGIEEKLLAVRALRRAGVDTSQATAEIATLVQNTGDPMMRARVFDSWDGSRDPAFKLPLVNGLQDPNPFVRQRAADALSGFTTDPAVQQWLNYITEHDPDPLVRREAFQALNETRR